MEPAERIASGHDCEIFAAGPGRVIRRARNGGNMAREAMVMRHAREHGFPVPEVFEVEGDSLLMERVPGPNLLEDLARHPWRLAAHARLLARLHDRLETVPAPDDLPEVAGFPGATLLHLDLHPLNVLLGEDGPRVIDWANAKRGARGVDTAYTWLLIGGFPARAPHLRAIRELFLRAFLARVDIAGAQPRLAALAELRGEDENVGPRERATIDRLVARAARRRKPAESSTAAVIEEPTN